MLAQPLYMAFAAAAVIVSAAAAAASPEAVDRKVSASAAAADDWKGKKYTIFNVIICLSKCRKL